MTIGGYINTWSIELLGLRVRKRVARLPFV